MSDDDDATTMDNDGIAEALHAALTGDENLSDEDRTSIVTKLSEKHGAKAPEVVKPKSEHWTGKKLW